MNELGGSTAPPLEATVEPKSLTQADVRRLHDEIGQYAQSRGQTEGELERSLGFSPGELFAWVGAAELHGGTTKSTLRSLEAFKANLNDPEKVKLIECMGIKVYNDPQPLGHPPSTAECNRITQGISSAQAQQTDWYVMNPLASVCQEAGMSPRQFYAGHKTQGDWADLVVNRSQIDNSIIGVDVKYLKEGMSMTLTFYPSLKQCSYGLEEAIRDGRVLPPDTSSTAVSKTADQRLPRAQWLANCIKGRDAQSAAPVPADWPKGEEYPRFTHQEIMKQCLDERGPN